MGEWIEYDIEATVENVYDPNFRNQRKHIITLYYDMAGNRLSRDDVQQLIWADWQDKIKDRINNSDDLTDDERAIIEWD